MSRALKRAVGVARQRVEATGYDPAAIDALREAERRLAAQRGEQWAELLDIGLMWDGGAPLPHVVSNGSEAVLVCFEAVHDPEWDGSTVRVVNPSNPAPASLLKFTFASCHSIKFGGPNDEVLNGHPLYGRGLAGYGPHLVHNSLWLAEEERINSVHAHHRGGWEERLNHYFFVFHDEMLEVLARDFKVEQIEGAIRDVLPSAAIALVTRDEPLW